jgi:hypothetical protein
MMTLEQFGSFEHVFTPEFQQAVEDIDAAPRQDRYPDVYTEFVMSIREALNPVFLVIIPDSILDTWICLFTSDDKISGWSEKYPDGELIVTQNVHRPKEKFVKIFFHEVQHLIDSLESSPETLFDEELHAISPKKYRMQLSERRAKRAETGIIRKVYKYYTRGQA